MVQNTNTGFRNQKIRTFARHQQNKNEKQEFYAHKLMLATVSPIFRKILVGAGGNQALLYLRGTKSENIEAMLNFIHTGEARIPTLLLNDFIAFGNEMKIFGMSEGKALFDKPVPFKTDDNNFAVTANTNKKFPETVEIDEEDVDFDYTQTIKVSSKTLNDKPVLFKPTDKNYSMTNKSFPETVEIEEITPDNTKKIKVSQGNFQCKDCPRVFTDILSYKDHF